MKINLNNHIPKIYNEFFYNIMNDRFDNYSLYGGRGSVKSSIGALVSVVTVKTGKGNVACIRRYRTGLKKSIYAEIVKVIKRLDIEDDFIFKVAPLEIHCKSTGYVILFEGLDDEQKAKGLTPTKGQFRLVLYEECQQIENEEKVAEVNATLARGDEHCNILYLFNPPPLKSHWTNRTLRETTEYLYALKVNFVDVPARWLGKQFIREAKRLEKVDYSLFAYRYLGEPEGRQGLVFNNIRDYTVDKSRFKTLQRGLDFGTAKQGDPSAYVVVHYDERNKDLYIVDEWYKQDTDYPEIAENILKENKNNFTVFCDNADNGGIKQLIIEGVKRAKGCKKGSVDNGVIWLRGLNNIYIDEKRTPHIYKEFSEYSYILQKSTGDYIIDTKNNHTLDATRYALSDYIEY